MSKQRTSKPQRAQKRTRSARRTRAHPPSAAPPGEGIRVLEPAAQNIRNPIPPGGADAGDEWHRAQGNVPTTDADLGAAGGGATGPGNADMNFPGANTGGAIAGTGPGGITVIATQPAEPQSSSRPAKPTRSQPMPRQGKVAPSKRSTSAKTTGKLPKEGPWRQAKPPRAHRDDTPEARVQRARAPKSHPGKATAPRNAMRRHKTKG